jgi:ribonuclease T1
LKGVFMKVARAYAVPNRWFSVILGLVLTVCTVLVHSQPAIDAPASPTLLVTDLPREGQETYQLIRKGGPFPYEKDGTVFGNRERLLPRDARGFSREYTVKTPGLKNRGARRIVCDGLPPDRPTDCFYTDDHYSSFRRIGQ